ncbi:primosomal protein N' [Ruminococcus sp. AF46-10NS]|nr:primosomal protein N' [Ruminococcus sp. AF46-10NS]RHK25156.1 primosomal protein N' [Ruminococcus sp. AF46-10NS]
MTYADVIIDISHEKVDRDFQYRIPDELEQEIKPGVVVTVPFGKGNTLRKGYVIGVTEKAKYDTSRIKMIQSVSTDDETTESRLIALAAWMKETYGSTMIQALKTVLPVKDKVRAKEKRLIFFQGDRNVAEELLAELSGSRFRARERFLRAILESGSLEYTYASKELGANVSVLDFFEKKGMIRLESQEMYRIPDQADLVKEDRELCLNEEQQAAAEQIFQEWQKPEPRPTLLSGVTGSGKTQVYMRLIQQVIEEGKQAIVLIPEIALTYQTVRRFYAMFGDKVSVLNSRLSQGERYDQFKRAKRGEVQVMVGPRSALFTPFFNLGLIVIDEEHEPTYKSENTPRYHARETAIQRARMEHANVVMGSATPSLSAYSRAESGEYLLVKLNARYEERPLPQVSIVDLREELKKGNRSVLSTELKTSLSETLRKKEQTMLFLNRRGYAGFVSCRACGHVMKCPHCDVSLSEHNGSRLICHYCGYETVKPQVCPSCGSPHIGGFKAGTQQIEKVLEKDFPEARVLRMDFDTTRTKDSYEKILASFSRHEADILVGTQMIVKGHDFPDVTLVGVIAADLSLNMDDYHCGERTFQLLTQAVGRAGRGAKPGRAVIQTYQPEHYSIQAAATQDYGKFYKEEMSYRMLMDYPPAAHMMTVFGACQDEELLKKAMYYIEVFIRRVSPKEELHMIGPAAASVGKVKDVYRQVLHLKHVDMAFLTAVREKLEQYIEINSGFRKIYIQFDMS